MQHDDIIVTAEEYYGEFSRLDSFMALKDGVEEYWHWPGNISSGFFYIIKLRPGIILTITSHQASQPLAIRFTENPACFILSFVLHGDVEAALAAGQVSHASENIRFDPSLGYLLYMPNYQGVAHLPPNHSCYVTIALEPWAFKLFWDEQFANVSHEIDAILQHPEVKREYHQPFTISPLVNMRLHEISSCPYQGSGKRYFLEAKVLEIIVLTLEQLKGRTTRNPLFASYQSNQDFVHHARDILLKNMANPPSLNDLAKQVGVNKNKLNQCFRERYGFSAFQFLRICRLEKSKKLLLNNQKNVAEVALEVGYSQQSSFTWEFKKYFGLSPREYSRKS